VDLPWAALPGRTSGYWIEDAPRMRVIESERALLEPRTESGRGLVAVGDPDFERTAHPADGVLAASVLRGPLGDCAGGGSLAFGALAGARAEAREIAATWDAAHPEARARLLVGADATVEALEREAPGHAVLHLATHGVVWGDSCAPVTANARGIGGVRPLAGTARPRAKATSAAHAAEPPAVAAAPGSAEDSPQASPWIGHRVWLALAGANHARDPGGTGLLTANDVSMLDLRGMEWVVLSACQSGVGDAWPREGAVGMQSAFRIAGARDVIASQWSIGDESTREWMRALYAARAGGATGAGDAAAAACRRVLSARRASKRSTHPFYWAGFTTVGL